MEDKSIAFHELKALGLNDTKVDETLKNISLTENLLDIIHVARKYKSDPFPKSMGSLLYDIATKLKPQIKHKAPLIIEYVAKGKIDSKPKLESSFEYFLSNPSEPTDIASFEKSFGFGVEVTNEDIEREVEIALLKHKSEIIKKEGNLNVWLLINEVRNVLKFADPVKIKSEFTRQAALMGIETLEKQHPAKVKNTHKFKKIPDKNISDDSPETKTSRTIPELMQRLEFHKPGENYKTDGYIITPNTMNLLQEHVKKINGQIRTRFPPEPNGILHIGHAKAININFGYAKAHNGICFLRYDDTNPEKEEEKFFKNILEMVHWLGYEPDYITHSSDYFDQLYNYAHQLIAKGHAYVCHQRQEDIKGFNPPPSPWRDRPIEESKQLFVDMAKGKFAEGEATLRMKVMLEEGKQDPVAYRIKYVPHPRTGDKWCIYPTYDFTHCLCDSIENITHSLCTKEFQSRRSSYYWLCNALDIYCPVQWEYGRLNLNYAVVSKRKILKLIEKGFVKDWDDPRLFTLPALRRRGFPPEAINNFCAQMGVTGAQTIVDPEMLEATVRDTLNLIAPRFMAVLEPLKVTITNLPLPEMKVIAPFFPFDSNKGSYSTTLYPTLYIESSDYRYEADNSYKRLTSKQSVGLRHAGLVLSFSKEIKDSNGKLTALEVTCQKAEDSNKPKAFIHWVSDPHICEVRLYNKLFLHKNPEDVDQVPNGFLSDINPDSLTVIADAMVVKAVTSVIPFKTLQFERIGYFCVDPDASSLKMVFNRTCNLKEDPKK